MLPSLKESRQELTALPGIPTVALPCSACYDFYIRLIKGNVMQCNNRKRAVYGSLLLSTCLLIGCASSPQAPLDQQPATKPQPDSYESRINSQLQQAMTASTEDAIVLRTQASRLALENGDTDTAAAILDDIPTDQIENNLLANVLLAKAEIALMQNDNQRALVSLTDPVFQNLPTEFSDLRRQAGQTIARIYLAQQQPLAAAKAITSTPLATTTNAAQRRANQIWEILSSAPDGALNAEADIIDSYELRGWLELTNIVNRYQNNIDEQVEAVERWQALWNAHPAASQLPSAIAYVVNLQQQRPQKVALLLPMENVVGQAISDGFMLAYYHAAGQSQPLPAVEIFDTSQTREISPLYQQAVSTGADLIIGPLDKELVRQLQSMNSLPTPTLALNYLDDGDVIPRDLYQYGLAPEDEIAQLTSLARQAGHSQAAVLARDGANYTRIRDSFTQQWQSLGGKALSSATFRDASSYSDTIRQLMHIERSEARADALLSTLPRDSMISIPRRRQDIDLLFLQATPAEGKQLLPTFAFHYAGDVPIYALPSIYDGNATPGANRDLNDTVFVDAPWLLRDSDELKPDAQSMWPDEGNSTIMRLRAMGIDSFRLLDRLAQLDNFPGVSLQGATGTLRMDESGRISRQLLPALFAEGQPVLISETNTEQ